MVTRIKRLEERGVPGPVIAVIDKAEAFDVNVAQVRKDYQAGRQSLANEFKELDNKYGAHALVREALRAVKPYPAITGVSLPQRYQENVDDQVKARAGSLLKQHPHLLKPIFSSDHKTSADVNESEAAQDALRHDPQLQLGPKPAPGCGKTPTPQPS